MTKPLNPWHPIADACDLKHLGKLSEELGECQAAVSRCVIQGVFEVHPETGKPNDLWLTEELADAIANVNLVVERFGLDRTFIHERSRRKYDRLKTWHDMA